MSARLTELEFAELLSRRGMKTTPRKPVGPVKREATQQVEPPSKKNKYGAKKTIIDNIVFDSKREATRYQDLKFMENAGLITDLTLQVDYPLVVNGVKIASYRSDFDYMQDGQKVVEDSKSDFTRKLLWYRMKKKLMLALHGIEIRET